MVQKRLIILRVEGSEKIYLLNQLESYEILFIWLNLQNSEGICTDLTDTEQKMKFSIKDFFSKCDQIRSFLRIWSHLLKKSSMENFNFCAVILPSYFSSDTL